MTEKTTEETVQKEVSKGEAISLEGLRGLWPDVVRLVERKRKSIGVFLREGSLTGLRGNCLEISFEAKNNFHREALESNPSKQVIEEALSEVTNRQLRLSFEMLPPEATPPPKPTLSAEDPIVKFSIDALGGNVIGAND